MKKVIIIEICLLFNLCIFLYIDISYIRSFIIFEPYLNLLMILSMVGTITDIIAMVLVALKDSVFKPILDKLEAKKQARNEAKALKAEEAKQAKIAELQAQLEELKKD